MSTRGICLHLQVCPVVGASTLTDGFLTHARTARVITTISAHTFLVFFLNPTISDLREPLS